MANIYDFPSLPHGDSIRVLILDAGRDDQPLSGELRVIFLNNRRQTLRSGKGANKRRKTSSGTEITRWTPDIPYEAISYVWGSDKKDHSIFLSGKTHQITANLSDALHQCRLPDQSRVLWADSICINQDNGQEKNHQVYLMGRIYASSQCTLICLGINPSDREHAQEASALIFDVNEMIQETFQRPGFSWKLNSFPRPLPDDPLVNDRRWRSIDILCCNPWFKRGWVLQEAALGHEARILWVGCKIALLDLIRADTWYFKRARYLSLEFDDRTRTIPRLTERIFVSKCFTECKVFFPYKSHIGDLGILSALETARRLHLSNPLDRIYAFMALPFVRNSMPDMRPNYELSHMELYQDFAVKYLKETSDLNILSHVVPNNGTGVSADGRLESSWVPQWDHESWHSYGRNRSNFGQKSAETHDFVILHGENGAPALLQVRAVIFDSIKLVSEQINTSVTVEDLATVWSQFRKRASSASRKVQSTSADDRLRFLKALTAGYFTTEKAVEDRAGALKSYANFLQANEQETRSQESPRISPEIQSCHRQLLKLAHLSHVFRLEKGYLGLGPWAIEQGDVCAFVFGVGLPLILRKYPDDGRFHYNVIGSAFVVSMGLNGQGIPMGLNERLGWEDWDKLCETEGWTDWGLKEERIVLH